VDRAGWDDNGYWVGPRDLRPFLRTCAFFVAFWYFVVSMIIWAVLVDVAMMSRLVAFPLALVLGAAATLGIMFAFSRGWIADGD
jgi:hypothetical protein